MELRMNEASDAPRVSEVRNKEISEEARLEFDELMEDDDLPEDLAFFEEAEIENYNNGSTVEQNSEVLYGEDGSIVLKDEICDKNGWSREVVDAIGKKEEAEVYEKAGLKEVVVSDKKCLVRTDLDMDQEDEFGRTNKERMENGMAPISQGGEIVELHHIGQKQDSPLAELTTTEHRRGGNDTILHDKQKESEIDRVEFANERRQHWVDRAEEE